MKKTLLVGAVAIALVLMSVGSAFAAETVQVNAEAKQKMVLTVAPLTLNFGQLDPGQAAAAQNVGVLVDSNKDFHVQRDSSDVNVGLMGLTFSGMLANQPGAKGLGVSFTDTYDVTIPWGTDPGVLQANVLYTLVTP